MYIGAQAKRAILAVSVAGLTAVVIACASGPSKDAKAIEEAAFNRCVAYHLAKNPEMSKTPLILPLEEFPQLYTEEGKLIGRPLTDAEAACVPVPQRFYE